MASKRIRNPFNDSSPDTRPGVNGSPIRQSPAWSNGMRPISPQQQLFVDYYIANKFKATDAAEQAGYKRNYAAQLLQLPNVQAAIQRATERVRRRIAISQDAVLEELGNIAFGNLAEFFNDFGMGTNLNIKRKNDLTEEQQRLMASIEETWRGNNRTLKFKAHDKMRALTLLAQYLGMLDGSGKQIDPEGMVARLREAATRATDSMPQTVAGDSSDYGGDSESEEYYDEEA